MNDPHTPALLALFVFEFATGFELDRRPVSTVRAARAYTLSYIPFLISILMLTFGR